MLLACFVENKPNYVIEMCFKSAVQHYHFSLLNLGLCVSHKLPTAFQALTEKWTYLEIRSAGLKILLVRRALLDAVV